MTAFLCCFFVSLVRVLRYRDNSIKHYQNALKIIKESKKYSHTLGLSTLIVCVRRLLH